MCTKDARFGRARERPRPCSPPKALAFWWGRSLACYCQRLAKLCCPPCLHWRCCSIDMLSAEAGAARHSTTRGCTARDQLQFGVEDLEEPHMWID